MNRLIANFYASIIIFHCFLAGVYSSAEAYQGTQQGHAGAFSEGGAITDCDMIRRLNKATRLNKDQDSKLPDHCKGEEKSDQSPSQAEEPNCSSRNLGDILLGNGSKMPEVSGITRRSPRDVYLVSDRTRWLYRARLSGGRWSVDRYGITDLSKGTGPNKDGIYDIEDVSYGPCPVKSEGKCIFIGEIGGNPHGKNVFKIHYIRESDLAGRRNKFVKTRKIRYRYPKGRKFDAEGLAVHPRTGEMFIVTKTKGSTSYIYKVVPRYPRLKPTKVAEIDLGKLFSAYNTNARQITGFEISPDGTQFTIVTYEALVKFNLDLARLSLRKSHIKLPGKTKLEIYSLLGDWWGKGVSLRRVQVESITYDGSQSHFLIIGEGRPTLMKLNCPDHTKKPGISKK